MAGELETEVLSLYTDTTGPIHILPVSIPPGDGAGTPAPVGSIAVSNSGLIYQKIDVLDTDWTPGTVLGAESKFTAFNNTPRGSQSTNYFTFLTLTVDVKIAGDYKLEYSYLWSSNSTSDNFLMRLLDENNFAWATNIMEPTDATGSGISVQRVDSGGQFNSNTSQRIPATGFTIVPNLSIGVHDFHLQMAGSAVNKRNAIYNVYLSLEKT